MLWVSADDEVSLLNLATRVAEVQVDLSRIRRVRNAILTGVVEDPPASDRTKASGDGNENVRDRSIRPTQDHIVTPSVTPDRVAALSRAIDRLAVIARYERRTLSRRKLAVRQLDEILQRQKRQLGGI